jgi:hypothetical protein
MKTNNIPGSRRQFLACQSLVVSLLLLLTILITQPSYSNANDEEWKPIIDDSSSSELFEIAHEIEVLAPSHFPKPTSLLNDSHVEVIVEPTFGTHRPDQDVVMAYAEGYTLPYYMMFIETLRKTGFDGDVVLAIAHYSLLAEHVLEYLQSQPNVIVYIHELHCYGPDQVTPSPRIMKRGSLDIFQMCHLHDVYGWKDATTGTVIRKAKDPRIGRVVATLRYEWYWIWAQQYNENAWIMLLDARDSFFQANPFLGLPRNQGGLLYFFWRKCKSHTLGTLHQKHELAASVLWRRNLESHESKTHHLFRKYHGRTRGH